MRLFRLGSLVLLSFLLVQGALADSAFQQLGISADVEEHLSPFCQEVLAKAAPDQCTQDVYVTLCQMDGTYQKGKRNLASVYNGTMAELVYRGKMSLILLREDMNAWCENIEEVTNVGRDTFACQDASAQVRQAAAERCGQLRDVLYEYHALSLKDVLLDLVYKQRTFFWAKRIEQFNETLGEVTTLMHRFNEVFKQWVTDIDMHVRCPAGKDPNGQDTCNEDNVKQATTSANTESSAASDSSASRTSTSAGVSTGTGQIAGDGTQPSELSNESTFDVYNRHGEGLAPGQLHDQPYLDAQGLPEMHSVGELVVTPTYYQYAVNCYVNAGMLAILSYYHTKNVQAQVASNTTAAGAALNLLSSSASSPISSFLSALGADKELKFFHGTNIRSFTLDPFCVEEQVLTGDALDFFGPRVYNRDVVKKTLSLFNPETGEGSITKSLRELEEYQIRLEELLNKAADAGSEEAQSAEDILPQTTPASLVRSAIQDEYDKYAAFLAEQRSTAADLEDYEEWQGRASLRDIQYGNGVVHDGVLEPKVADELQDAKWLADVTIDVFGTFLDAYLEHRDMYLYKGRLEALQIELDRMDRILATLLPQYSGSVDY